MPAHIVLTLDEAGTPPALLAVDPTSGTVAMIPLARHGRLTGALALDETRVLAGVYDDVQRQTVVLGVAIDTRTVTALGELPGDTQIQTLTPDGRAIVGLRLTAFRPTAALALALPPTWLGAPLSTDRSSIVWLGRAAVAPQPEPLVLARRASVENQQLSWQRTAVTLSPYVSLLLDRQREQIYAVDFFQQTITLVSTTSGRALQSVRFGTIQTKRPPCAALLAPTGETLYALANKSAYEGAGLLVYETPALRLHAHWFAEETQFSCLGLSIDGRWLYLLTEPGSVSVVDSRSGALLNAFPLGRPALGMRFLARTGWQ
jgi:hypothetical protein